MKKMLLAVVASVTVVGGLVLLGAPAASASSLVVAVPVGTAPYGVAVDPTTDTVYVANDVSNSVSVLDGATNTVTAAVNVAANGLTVTNPYGVAVDPTTDTVYVADEAAGSISVLDGATNTVTATVNVGTSPESLAVDPTTDTVYAANNAGDTVSVIDGATNTVIASEPVGSGPYGVAVDPTTDTVYVANNGSNSVSAIDGATNAVIASEPVGSGPYGVAVDPSTDTVYAANFNANTVSVLDGASVLGGATLPGAPAGLAAVAGSGQVVLSWNAPSNTGGDPVTGYAVTFTAAGSTTSGVEQVGVVTMATITGLANGTQYSLVVTAQTDQGAGVPSVAVTATPLAPPPAAASPGCSQQLSSPSAVGVAETPDGAGYWIASSTGSVVNCGDATALGSAVAPAPIVGITAASPGQGYWLVDSRGDVYAFGSAAYHGGTGALHLNKPIVGITADPTTGGYWLVAADGGVFSFNAPFEGSASNLTLNQPVVAIASAPQGTGYWLAAADGGVFAYGNAAFEGSAAQ